MSVVIRCSLGLAAALGAMAAFTVPATADHLGFQHSNNCVREDVPVDFMESDIGLMIDLVFAECGSTATSELYHGDYRRVSNWPNSDGSISAGNARLDAVVYDTLFSNANPCRNNNNADPVTVSPGCIENQIGVDFDPPITLAASINDDDTSAVTIEDRTGAGGDNPFLPGQLVDAGLGVGGFDCVIFIKNGTPKLADIICDMNMWYTDDFGNIVYGLRDYNFGQPINRLLLMWIMGPNPTGSMEVTNDFCSAINAGGAIPARDFAGDLMLTEDPSDYALGIDALREETSITAAADYLRVYGEPTQPFNLVSCFGTAAYCDPTEPTPDPTAVPPQVSGNACNRNVGAAAPPEIRVNQTIPGNSGFYSTQGGGSGFGELDNPFD